MSDPSRAIVHDQFRTMGGAERVACELARTFDCPIYAGRVDDGVAPDDVDVREVFDGRVGRRAMRSHYYIQDAYQMLAWQQQPALREFDTLIVDKTNPLWFVPQEQQTVVAYVHSTPRGFYDQFARHTDHVGVRALTTLMRVLYGANRLRPDAVACNSELVARRLDLYWDRDDATVIYPPVDTQAFGPEYGADGGYIATVSRLYGHKRVRELIEAARTLDQEFVIAGDGPARAELERDAPENVLFTGYISESEKRTILASADAVWFGAENEDFGIVPIEAMASGTPVIGVREGFTEHQIQHGRNGLLYDRGVNSLIAAIRRFDERGVSWSADEIQAFAERFDREQFRAAIREWVTAAERETTITTPWERESDDVAVEPVRADGGDGDD